MATPLTLIVIAFCVCFAYAEPRMDLQTSTLVHKVPMSSGSRNFSEPWYYKAMGYLLPNTNSDDMSIHFATCLATENNHVCNVTHLTYLFDNGTIEENCTNIHLTSTKEIEVFPLYTNRVYVKLWKPIGNNESELWMGFVNLDNCKVFDLYYTTDTYPVYFNDRVDVFRNSPNECGNLDTCRVSYDYNGKLIGKPTPFTYRPTAIITPVDPWSPNQGYIARLLNRSNLTTMHLNAVGEATIILLEGPTPLINMMRLSVASTAHGLYTSCWRLDDSIRCQQIHDRKLILNRRLDNIPWTSNHNLLGVHSLAKGVILLAVIDCDDDRCTTVRLRIVKSKQTEREDRRWLVVRGIDFKFDNPFMNEIRLTESGDRYCLALACEITTFEKTYVSYLKYHKWCLPKIHVAVLDTTIEENHRNDSN